MSVTQEVMVNAIKSLPGEYGSDFTEPFLAVGVFGLQDNYAGITAAGFAGGEVADAVSGGDANPAVAGVAAAASVHVARDVNAARQGLSVSMLVAVTETRVVVYDWGHGGVTRMLHLFNRDTLKVSTSNMGLSTRLVLEDTGSGFVLKLTGSKAFYSSVSQGDKNVLSVLAN